MDENKHILDKNLKSEDDFSTKIYLSVAMGSVLYSFLTMVVGTRLFDFYENEVGKEFGTGKKKGIRARYVALKYLKNKRNIPKSIEELLTAIFKFRDKID